MTTLQPPEGKGQGTFHATPEAMWEGDGGLGRLVPSHWRDLVLIPSVAMLLKI